MFGGFAFVVYFDENFADTLAIMCCFHHFTGNYIAGTIPKELSQLKKLGKSTWKMKSVAASSEGFLTLEALNRNN